VQVATTASKGDARPGAQTSLAHPRTGPAEVAAIALGTLLLVDVLRVWLPSLITIYGSAGSTPPAQIGAFALLWFAAPVVAVPVARLVGADRLAFAAALALAFAKFTAGASGGGATRDSRVQLYLLCAALTSGLVWLISMAMSVRSARRAAVGVTSGLAASVALHTALDTVDLHWRPGPAAALAQAALACAFVGCVAAASGRPIGAPMTASGPSRPGARGGLWLLAGPAILLTGVVTGATGLAETAPGWSIGVAGSIVAAATVLAMPLAARPLLTRHPVVPAGLLVAGVTVAIVPRFRIDGIAGLPPPWVVAGQVAGAVALGAALGWIGVGADTRAATSSRRDRPWRRGVAAWLGGLLLVALTYGYYAAYDVDLSLPNEAVPIAVAAGIAIAAVRVGPRARRWGAPVGAPVQAGWLAAAAVAMVAAMVGVQVVTAPARPAGSRPVDGFPVRLVAYNVRMGFGLDGRFDPGALATTIRRQRPDLVLLSEVDRGWFVNGGHDGLQLIADRLGMRAIFAPAADQLWGDALLTRLPVVSFRSHPLPRHGASTGAEALAAVVRVGDRELGVVGTHLQPPPGRDPVAQARATAGLAAELGRERPVVVGGDLNTEPGDPAFQALLDSGLLDAFAAVRPLRTSTADDPSKQIDHVLVSPGIAATEVDAPRSIASDHLAVAVTLTLP
jgi:endonuclease/exonuclease/phosphatase family metal-dependent hydrolase